MSWDLVVFGEDWGGHPTSTQHLIRALLPERRVLWANSIGLRRPRLGDAGRALRKLRALAGPSPKTASANDEPRPGIVFQPPAIPWPGSRLAGLANRELIGRAVRAKMAELGIRRPVLWTSLPTAAAAVGTLGESLVVYYCGDDFGALDGVDHAAVLRLEAELAGKADLVLVSHPNLMRKFAPEKTHLIPHGVDLDRFVDAAPVRDAAESVKVAGFVGSIDERLHVPALVKAALALPAWRFAFHGPVKTDVRALVALPNVSFLGPLDPSLVPGRVRGFDVALLPYRDTPMVRACNPLKLREYLATGTPVAALPMPALDEFAGLVQLADEEGLAGAIQAAAGTRGDAARRQARVEGESWSVRAEAVARLIEAQLERRRAA